MNKKFIFKYEPQSSVKEMFIHLEETVKTGKKYIQPKNVSIINDLAVISRILSKTRLELFTMIREKQPNNIQELAQLLHRDYANVWRDCQVLASCKVIELEKTNQEIKPIALYDQIVISYPEKLNGHLEIEANYDKELEQLATQKTFINTSQHHRRWEYYWKTNYGK
jgi:predicted transcriptional regulator